MFRLPELYLRKRRLEPSPISRPDDHSGLRLGMWYWKDETRTLEFRSFTPAVELKEKGKKGKAVHFAEIDGPASERLADKRFVARDDKSTKALEKRGQQGNVTLDDAKYVALLLLQETEMQRICSFTTFMRNKNLDNFLMALLYYLSHFLQKNSLEKKPKSYMVGRVEKKEMELVLSKLAAAQKYLAQKYCVLVLGLGMPDKHHMCCGKRMMAKRPAIKKAINMRSPVMSTLLPSLKEKAQNIFEKKYHQAGIRLPAQIQKHMDSLDSVPMPIVGILGEPRCLFNPHTLLPLEPEENMNSSGRNHSLIERNNTRIQDTLDFVMRALSSNVTVSK
ncbi:protein phosphatase 1 regulatory subunit 36 isoform X4 [Choloepus didactylus]|uniref:protein phosphatase 1 regulatory subunit 36 isoform X4 n=1 Tax=Choloepus didactylus TaxID=27675 RepID=UPI00189ECF47|nr:protein phosphatase 1 regulatory subunit 36 isoform X4 [Choloepus didactylus]